MKPDFKRIIVERPREGYKHKHRKFRDKTTKIQQIDELTFQQYDDPFMDLPSRESIRNRRHEKFQTDLLSPLRGYLQSNLHRPWDEVWSEICRSNKGHMGQHLRDHVLAEVAIDVSEVDGETLYDSKGQSVRIRNLHGETFYVHPITKTLEMTLPQRMLRNLPSKIVRMDGKEYFKTSRGWFEVQIVHVDARKSDGGYYGDVFRNCWWAYNEESVVISKRQVDKRLCRRIDKKQQQIAQKAA